MTLDLTADLFDGHVGHAFQVSGLGLILVLTRVERRAMQAWEVEIAPRPPFTLVFQGPANAVLAEGLRTLETENGAAYDLYVIPTHTPTSAHQNYQAVFN